MKVGDRVKHLYPLYETGTVVRIDPETERAIMVTIDNRPRFMGAMNFKEEHLEIIAPQPERRGEWNS